VIPDDRSYTAEHEWLLDGRVGLTSVATEALGDIVFLELPAVGAEVVAGEVCGEVESTKSVSELFSPVTGVVTAVHAEVVEDPAAIGAAPYDTWLFEVDATAPGTLLTAAEYRAGLG
jgi:glycine cleavage system H protein